MRDKKSHEFYLYEGKDKSDTVNVKFCLMAKFFPQLDEFRIYALDKNRYPHLWQDDQHMAKVIFNRRKKQFIIKGKYCLNCS